MKDNRIHTRFRKSFVVKFALKNSPQKVFDISKLSDISKGGLSFFALDSYPNGTIFSLIVNFPYDGEVAMEGEVVNVQKVVPNNVHKIGVKFIQLSPEATAALEQMERYNLEKTPPPEQRAHVRIEQKFMALFYLKDKQDGIHTLAWFQDISRGGLKFFSLEPYPAGTVLVFNIQFPFSYPQITAIEGEVLDCEDIVAGKTYRIRVQFTNLGPEAVSALEKMEK